VIAISCYSIKLKVRDSIRGKQNIFFIFNTESQSDLRCLLLKIASSSVPIDTGIVSNIIDFQGMAVARFD
jgi:hypothetical protein